MGRMSRNFKVVEHRSHILRQNKLIGCNLCQSSYFRQIALVWRQRLFVHPLSMGFSIHRRHRIYWWAAEWDPF